MSILYIVYPMLHCKIMIYKKETIKYIFWIINWSLKLVCSVSCTHTCQFLFEWNWVTQDSTEHSSISLVRIFENNSTELSWSNYPSQQPLMDSHGLWLWTLRSQVLVACPTFSRGTQRWASDKRWSISIRSMIDMIYNLIWSACMHVYTHPAHILPKCLQPWHHSYNLISHGDDIVENK